MPRELKLLLIEDSEDDAALLVRELRKAGYILDVTRIDTRDEMRSQLEKSAWDIIISDYSLPGFSGRKALDIYKEKGLDIPFIVISGAIGETMAVEMMKAGAHDYLMKGNLARLGPAIERELQEAEMRRQSKEAHARLRESEERWHYALEGSGDGVWDWDVLSDHFFFSHRWKEMLGYTEDEIGDTLDEWTGRVHPEDLPMVKEAIDRILEGSRTQFMVEFRMGCHDGSYKWILARGKVIAGDPSGPLRIVGTHTDITERRAAEEERIRLKDKLYLIEKYDTLGRLAGGIAHDFNNMLVPIIGYTELTLASIPRDNPLVERLKNILNAAEAAKDLTRQILAFSRKQVLELKNVDLNEEILSIQKMIKRLIGEDILVETDLDPRLHHMKADQSQLQQIIMNMAINARDAMPGGGRLLYMTRNIHVDRDLAGKNPDMHPGDYVLFSISDTGVGIRPEIMDRIFEPFFTTKEEGKGTGLGLATVYGIVKQHGGTINVSSEQGSGSTFTLYFPVTADAVGPDVERTGEGGDYSGGEPVLVVEDSESVRDLTRQVLEHYGYTVYVAQGRDEALDIMEEKGDDIRLVLLDVVMPGGNGFELYERILEKHPGIKCVFMSGYPENIIERTGISSSSINYIQKPFTMDALGSMVRKVLGS